MLRVFFVINSTLPGLGTLLRSLDCAFLLSAVLASLGSVHSRVVGFGVEAIIQLVSVTSNLDIEAVQTRLAEEGACSGEACFLLH